MQELNARLSAEVADERSLRGALEAIETKLVLLSNGIDSCQIRPQIGTDELGEIEENLKVMMINYP